MMIEKYGLIFCIGIFYTVGMSNKRNVSVVVPVLNEEKLLPGMFDSLLKQIELPNEVLVVDGKSSDKTPEICVEYGKKFKKLGVKFRVLIEKKPGIIRARDLGTRQAVSEVISSMDADAVYPRDYLKIALSCFSHDKVVGVSGKNEVVDPAWFVVVERRLQEWRDIVMFKLIKTIYFPRASNLLFLKSVYLKSGGMDVEIRSAEDEWGMAKLLNRFGKVYFDGRLKVLTSGRRMKQGFLVFIFKTVIWDYWLGYFRGKYLRHRVRYDRVD